MSADRGHLRLVASNPAKRPTRPGGPPSTRIRPWKDKATEEDRVWQRVDEWLTAELAAAFPSWEKQDPRTAGTAGGVARLEGTRTTNTTERSTT